jgi:hypothetical protein
MLRAMDRSAVYHCAFCGEPVETSVDPSAGRAQEYVEDCWVCCRPNVLSVQLAADGSATITARPES